MTPEQLALLWPAPGPRFRPSLSGNGRGEVTCSACGLASYASASVRARRQSCERCGAVLLEVLYLR